jgi:hypothetical protein
MSFSERRETVSAANQHEKGANKDQAVRGLNGSMQGVVIGCEAGLAFHLQL